LLATETIKFIELKQTEQMEMTSFHCMKRLD